jgi:arylsulfatase A-like enzyme
MTSTQQLALVLLLAGSVLAGCRGSREWSPRHVFLITVDTLRADHLGSYGYPRGTSPNLDRLAAEGVLFEAAIAQWPQTGPSFASMFTGRYPLSTGLTHKAAVRIPEQYLTLPAFLKANGFTSLAVISNAVLSAELGWDRGFDEYIDLSRLTGTLTAKPEVYRSGMNAGRVDEFAFPLLERYRDADRLFAWIHYSDPHAPYLLPEGFENPFLDDPFYVGTEVARPTRPQSTAIPPHRELKWYVAQYDANVLYVDLHVEKLIRRLVELDLLDESLIIFTADHGESLGEHDYTFEHGRLPYNTTAHVPLFLWSRHLAKGRRIDLPVELVDLYPTLRELIAPEASVEGLEGKSLTSFLARKGSSADDAAAGFRYAFSQAGGGAPLTHFRSVQDREAKLVYHPPREQGQPAAYQFYDLRRDPMETHDLLADAAEPAGSTPAAGELRRLRQALLEWMAGRDWIYPPAENLQNHDQETAKALKALGYVD